MNYKKIVVGFVLFCCVFFVGWNVYRLPAFQTKSPVVQKGIQKQSLVRVTINTGDSVATYDGVLASTVFEGLKNVTKKNNIPLETKQYDFGVFVEKIGNLVNTNDKSWIYYVNGISGDVAADKKGVKNADFIEWRYTKPIF